MPFLPTDHPDTGRVDEFFQILDSVLEVKSCAYIAGPLNTGRTYYERTAAGELNPHVRPENEKRMHDFAETLRKMVQYPVFNSGLLKITEWSGQNYGTFFLEVISRYARECWFLDGWEYSTGATKEFIFCCTIQTPCFTESGRIVTIPEALQLIGNAADVVRDLKLNDAKLRSRIADLNCKVR
jgi:hypothetical protein